MPDNEYPVAAVLPGLIKPVKLILVYKADIPFFKVKALIPGLAVDIALQHGYDLYILMQM